MKCLGALPLFGVTWKHLEQKTKEEKKKKKKSKQRCSADLNGNAEDLGRAIEAGGNVDAAGHHGVNAPIFTSYYDHTECVQLFKMINEVFLMLRVARALHLFVSTTCKCTNDFQCKIASPHGAVRTSVGPSSRDRVGFDSLIAIQQRIDRLPVFSTFFIQRRLVPTSTPAPSSCSWSSAQ